MDELIRNWDGEYIVSRFDHTTQTWIFIAIHSSVLGVPSGGTRLKNYPHPRDALRDAMRLAKGMTHKFAVIDFPRGGAKAVMAVPQAIDSGAREALLMRFGRWLSDLKGIFETGPDFGTTSEDMDLIHRSYRGVFGVSPEFGGSGNPGPETALGVFSGIKASCEHYLESTDLTGLTVLVQGVGSVGDSLVRRLVEAGCRVKFSDVDQVRIDRIREEFGLPFVEPDAVFREPCDVLAPCATGGILNAETIPQLSCRIVAGAANNQLETHEDGEALHKRGILYAPDYVINAGGAIFLPAVEAMGWPVERARERILGIGDTLKEVYTRAEKKGISPARAAEDMAEERVKGAVS
jgi:leucine dehydrogenase